jgi:23S rRNA-/tRNA-specific pseudouridylate synthase
MFRTEQVIDRELSKKQQLNKSQRRRAANKKKQQQKHECRAAASREIDTRAAEYPDQPEPEPEPEPKLEPEPNTAEVEAARSSFSIERTLWEHEGSPRVSLLRGRIAWQQFQRKKSTPTSCTADVNARKPMDVLAPPPRRHQLRRHLSGASHPVLGDTQYGKGRINRCVSNCD